jgi:hypothetical protein
MREVRLLASLQDENISRVLAVSATSGRARTSSRTWGLHLGKGLKTGLRIRIHFIRIRIPGFNDQKLKKLQLKKFFFFFLKNYNLPIPRPP